MPNDNQNKVKYCIYCGADVEEGEVYCPKCGKSTLHKEKK